MTIKWPTDRKSAGHDPDLAAFSSKLSGRSIALTEMGRARGQLPGCSPPGWLVGWLVDWMVDHGGLVGPYWPAEKGRNIYQKNNYHQWRSNSCPVRGGDDGTDRENSTVGAPRVSPLQVRCAACSLEGSHEWCARCSRSLRWFAELFRLPPQWKGWKIIKDAATLERIDADCMMRWVTSFLNLGILLIVRTLETHWPLGLFSSAANESWWQSCAQSGPELKAKMSATATEI